MNKQQQIALGTAAGSIGVFLTLFYFGRVELVLMQPLTTATQLIEGAPYWVLESFNGLILQQPSSTLWVFLLGLVTVGVGVAYLRTKGEIPAWLGINFVFWGVGAWVAGISYQAFGAALKCVGDAPCSWTNGVELFYMILTVLSINALLVAYSGFTQGTTSRRLKWMALISVCGYGVLQGVGMLMPNQFLLSYEFMLIFLAANIVVMMRISYQRKALSLHARLWTIWLLFLGVNAAYFVALFSGYAVPLYESTGIWFNENDVLHVLLLVWMLLWVTLVKPHEFTANS